MISHTSHKTAVHKSIVTGASVLAILVAAGWYVLPNDLLSKPSDVLGWLFLYAVPLLFALTNILLKRYQSEHLIQGYQADNTPLTFDTAFAQNTLEQTIIAVLVAVSFAYLAQGSALKLVPVHLAAFLLGRLWFWVGYKKSPMRRLSGFVLGNYANIGLFFVCLYRFATGF